MPRIDNTVRIARHPDTVFATLATPAFWPCWHPSSVAVVDAVDADRPLRAGEFATERFAIAGWRDEARWYAAICEPPWELRLETANAAGSGWLHCRLERDGAGTHLSRSLVYERYSVVLRALDRALFRRFVAAAERRAADNLRSFVEARYPAA
jgi:hypothetical protein